MQHSAYGLIVLLTLTAMPLSVGAAPARADRQANCVASVDAIRAEWRDLSHSSSLKGVTAHRHRRRTLVGWLAAELCPRRDWPGGQRVRGW